MSDEFVFKIVAEALNLEKVRNAVYEVDQAMKNLNGSFSSFIVLCDAINKKDKLMKGWGEEAEKLTSLLTKAFDTIKKEKKALEDNKDRIDAANISVSNQVNSWVKCNLLLKQYKKVSEKLPADMKKNLKELEKIEKQLKDNLTGAQKWAGNVMILGEKMKAAGSAVGNVGKKVGEATDALAGMKIISKETTKRIKDGFDGAKETLNGAGQAVGGFGQILSGDVFNGVVNMIKGIGTLVGGVKKLWAAIFGDRWKKRAKEELNGLEGVTDDMVKKLRDTAEKLKEDGVDGAKATGQAMNKLMSEFIGNAVITTKAGLTGWARKVEGMMTQLSSVTGKDAAKLTDQIGDSFSKLVEKADKLKLHGSKAMLDMIRHARDLKKQGKEIPEVFEYVTERLNNATKAVKTYLGTFADTAAIQKEITQINDKLAEGNVNTEAAAKLQDDLLAKQTDMDAAVQDIQENWDFIQTASLSTFAAMIENGKSFVQVVKEMGPELTQLGQLAAVSGMEISGGLKEMTDMTAFIQQNETLCTRIDASVQLMSALGEASYLTADDFSNFSTKAVSDFDALMASQDNERQALLLLAPQLDNLIKYADEYGYKIDDQTQSLIENARAEGVLTEKRLTEGEKQTLLLERMLEFMGGKLPYAVEELGKTVSSTMKTSATDTEAFQSKLDKLQAPSIEVRASWSVDNFPSNAIPRDININAREYDQRYAAGTGGWLEITKPTHILVGEGGETEYMNIIPRSKLHNTETISPITSIHPRPDYAPRYKGTEPGHSDREEGNTYNEYFIFENISFNSENGQQAMEEFMDAFKENKFGIKSLIKRAVRE